MDGGDWRIQVQPESSQRIVNKIGETLKGHIPFAGEEGLLKPHQMAVRLEEKIYNVATSQSDYLGKICLKMLMMESKSQLPAEPRTELEMIADKVEEKMCSAAMSQHDFIRKLDNLKEAIDQAIVTEYTASSICADMSRNLKDPGVSLL